MNTYGICRPFIASRGSINEHNIVLVSLLPPPTRAVGLNLNKQSVRSDELVEYKE